MIQSMKILTEWNQEMTRPPRTFYEDLLRRKVQAKKAQALARKIHKEAVERTGGDDCDSNFYNLLTTDERLHTIIAILHSYRAFKAQGKN